MRARIKSASFDVMALPSVCVHEHPAELRLTWSDMVFSSGWSAFTVAKTAAGTVMPELENVPSFRVEVRAQDPDRRRRRPVGS